MINLSLLFVLVSLNTENFLNTFGILQGPYKEMNSAWYIEFGSMIVWTMVMEMPMPHGFPCLILGIILLQRWYDRKFSKDKTVSRKKIQQDYEDLYVGPEFLLDSRLAQVVAIIQCTFIYSPALPLLFPLAVCNLTMIYWIDKTFVLRFNRTPRNYDETIIYQMIYFLKLTFPCHLVGGLFLLSNNAILQSNSFENENTTIVSINEWSKNAFGFNLLSD